MCLGEDVAELSPELPVLWISSLSVFLSNEYWCTRLNHTIQWVFQILALTEYVLIIESLILDWHESYSIWSIDSFFQHLDIQARNSVKLSRFQTFKAQATTIMFKKSEEAYVHPTGDWTTSKIMDMIMESTETTGVTILVVESESKWNLSGFYYSLEANAPFWERVRHCKSVLIV
jgi:hypothetical protein